MDDTLRVWGHRGAVTAVHRHAHRDCTVYQPSGFHGYPLTCAHLHPKPSERKRRDKKTVKRAQVTGTEVNADGFDGDRRKGKMHKLNVFKKELH